MEKDINIAKILKDMPIGIELYSPICGECELMKVDMDKYPNPILVKHWHGNQPITIAFTTQGYLYDFPDAECLLFPSKSMKDWSKLTWKKGDVLVSNNHRIEIIFKCFADHYTNFMGKHRVETFDTGETDYIEGTFILPTENYSIEDKDAAQCYLNTIEERLDGKLDKETLKIESKPECPFKPFDRVLVRDLDTCDWRCALFSHRDNNERYVCTGYSWKQCIPYEGNEHLLGTTNSPENS